MPRVRPGLKTVLLVAAAWTAGGADDAPVREAAGGPAKDPAPAAAPPEKADANASGKTDAKPPGADAKAVEAMTADERVKRLEGAMTGLAAALSKVRSVRASFVQRKRLEVFGGDVETRGTFALRVPGCFRWETTEPFRTTLVVNGARGLRSRTSRKGVVTETTFDLASDPVTAATVEQVFLWTTGDFAKASASHELALVSEEPLVVRATPRDETVRKVVASVELGFGGKPVHLARVTLAERAGSRTEMTFSSVEHDPELPDSLFAVEPAADRKR